MQSGLLVYTLSPHGLGSHCLLPHLTRLTQRMSFLLCLPVSRFWNLTIGNSQPLKPANRDLVNGQPTPTFTCPSGDSFATSQYVGFSFSASSDLLSCPLKSLTNIVMALPLSRVFSLRISTMQKAALAGIFALGIIYSAVEIARLLYVALAVDGSSLAYVNASMLFNPVQGSMAVCVACLPILRPLIFKRTSGTTRRSSGSDGRGKLHSSNDRRERRGELKGIQEDEVGIIKMVDFEITSETGAPSSKYVTDFGNPKPSRVYI
jgi:hypothetical protein